MRPKPGAQEKQLGTMQISAEPGNINRSTKRFNSSLGPLFSHLQEITNSTLKNHEIEVLKALDWKAGRQT